MKTISLNKKTGTILFFVLVVMSTGIIGIVHAGTETLITTNTSSSSQKYPAISGNWIVWMDYRHSGGSTDFSDVYAYNVVTGLEKRITPPGSAAEHPSISGTKIAYDDYRNENDYNIFLYDLDTDTEIQITDDPDSQEFPSISGNTIVWQDDREGA